MGYAHYGVHGRAYIVRHVGQEFGLGVVCAVGGLNRLLQLFVYMRQIFAVAALLRDRALLLRAQQYENDRDRNARHSQREYQHDPRNDTYQPDGICRNVFGRHEKQYRPLRVIQLFQPVVILGAV